MARLASEHEQEREQEEAVKWIVASLALGLMLLVVSPIIWAVYFANRDSGKDMSHIDRSIPSERQITRAMVEREAGIHALAGMKYHLDSELVGSATVKRRGENGWRVEGQVRGPNVFGAKLTHEYVVTMREVGQTLVVDGVLIGGELAYINVDRFAYAVEKAAGEVSRTASSSIEYTAEHKYDDPVVDSWRRDLAEQWKLAAAKPAAAEEAKANGITGWGMRRFRTWRSADGDKEVFARLVGFKDGDPYIENASGEKRTFPRRFLSERDLSYIDEEIASANRQSEPAQGERS